MNQKTLRAINQGDFFGVNLHVERVNHAEFPHLSCVAGQTMGVPVFCVNDLSEVFGTKPKDLLRKVPADEKLIGRRVLSGQGRNMWFVTKQGLYRLMMKSHHPDAEKFIRWITYEVLPEIEATGLYCGDAAGLAEALMTSRNYAQVRGLAGSVHGLGITAMAVCRRSGLAWRARRKKGHEFPVAALDRAAAGRRAERGPLAERQDGEVFFFDPAAAGQNGGEA